MAKYSDIKGFTVQTLSTDTVASQAAGGSWASGGSMPAGKYVGLSAGTQTSNVITGGANDPPANSNQDAIVFAGYDSSPASFPTATEEWNLPDFEIKTVTTS